MMNHKLILKEIMKNLSLTQTELSAILGVSFGTVNRWLNGNVKPTKSQMREIEIFAKLIKIKGINSGKLSDLVKNSGVIGAATLATAAGLAAPSIMGFGLTGLLAASGIAVGAGLNKLFINQAQSEESILMTEKKDPKKSPKENGGPVVKTGPTAGKVRTRKSDGSWRKKRSDAGKPRE